ncbi:histidine N-alpha-methyltransferase [Rubrobacter xylanophilus]|uniref:Histidine N-alpha-methyltransferase n=1 Tax=Rubrobacter xylanophilus TaxID=49319 RepID=A0A510HML9_9ACTN|nr:L-histidine N(alpha)-methyltransferase [Rubrobacter xylanophilus]BBL81174.1 histidine N-alpha-methyltransferase [Rubrobacter xylanophilus]
MTPGRLEIFHCGGCPLSTSRMADDVRRGLSSAPKDLSPWPKYLYDGEGSHLFEEITRLPEYYQTRAEASILRRRAEEIVVRTGCRELVELGSGAAGEKTLLLLDALTAHNGGCAGYAPLDVSEDVLRKSGERLLREYPGLTVRGFVGDFEEPPERLLAEGPGAPRLVAFLGGTIGNLTPRRRRRFLGGLVRGFRRGDALLVGVDLVKDARTLEAAYNDRAGITARFNKNLLRVINDRLGGGFDPDLFEHRAPYVARDSRIEMWLLSRTAQRIPVKNLGLTISFAPGEGMRTEISTKFTSASARRMLEETGLRIAGFYTDEARLFGLLLAVQP